ncbi:MAG: ATP-binding cassette domain-containing protein, partial [Actinobacteria bacterium]|nr:ATP-binding cassette domain-containing protein [Actinomycetota bacterium]
MTNDKPVLIVDNLSVRFPIGSGLVRKAKGYVKAVNSVSFVINQGETLGLVGESGSGKTTIGRAIVRVNDPHEGSILLDGAELVGLSPKEMRPLRRKVQMVFQDPYSSLDPRQTVRQILVEPLVTHNLPLTNAQGEDRVAELLNLVGLDPAFASRYPHQFSGGQRQRIGIARALAVEPDLIICDEPISALDVSIQAQVVNLLESLKKRLGIAYLFIAHDLAVVRHISDRVAVMYLGGIVELTTSAELYENPRHPYTRALLSAVPVPDSTVEKARKRIILQGDIPSPTNM